MDGAKNEARPPKGGRAKWRRRESNPGPETLRRWRLHAYYVF